MDWKQGFYQAVKDYFDLPEDATITSIEEEASEYNSGCHTCGYGGGMSYSFEIYYYTKDSNQTHYKNVDGKLGDFISSL